MSCPFLSLNCTTHDSPCSFGSRGKNKKWPYFTIRQHPRCEASQQASDYIWYLISFSRRVPVRIIFSLVICWEEYCPLYVASVIASSNHCVNTSFCRISDGMTVCKGMTAPHNIWLFDSVFVRLPHLFILILRLYKTCIHVSLEWCFLPTKTKQVSGMDAKREILIYLFNLTSCYRSFDLSSLHCLYPDNKEL